MIEQTPLVISEWNYHEPDPPGEDVKFSTTISLDVMKKRAGIKKGIA